MARRPVRGWYTARHVPQKQGNFAVVSVSLGVALALAAVWVAGSRVAVAAAPGQAATETQPPNRVEIFADVNVRGGPNTYYDLVGVLVPGQTSAIIGRNPEGTWFEINISAAPTASAGCSKTWCALSAISTPCPP